jgi:hypothetical protein
MQMYEATFELLDHELFEAVIVGLVAQNREEAAQKAPAFVHNFRRPPECGTLFRLGRIIEPFTEVGPSTMPGGMEGVTNGWVNPILRRDTSKRRL